MNRLFSQESLSGQQSNFFPANDFLGGSKLSDFSSIQGKEGHKTIRNHEFTSHSIKES